MEVNQCKKVIGEINNTITDIKEKSNFKFDKSNYVKIDQKIQKIQKQINKSMALDSERNTLVLISKQKNKNIEIYYLIYLLFSIVFIVIQFCIIFLLN